MHIQVDEYDRLHPTQQDSPDSPSGGQNSEDGPVPDFAKTSLKGALKTFDRTFMNEMRATVRYVDKVYRVYILECIVYRVYMYAVYTMVYIVRVYDVYA